MMTATTDEWWVECSCWLDLCGIWYVALAWNYGAADVCTAGEGGYTKCE